MEGMKRSNKSLSKEDELNLNGFVGGTGSSVGHEAEVVRVRECNSSFLVIIQSLLSAATMHNSGNLHYSLL